MSPTHSRKARRDHLRSKGPFLEVRLLACGHGDTILVRLPGPKWILIDCNLRTNESKRRFFELVTAQDIQRLDVLILTHPHYDHYVGMIDIVDHFTADGRRIGYFCDSGLNWHHVTAVLEAKGRPDAEVREYVRLVRRIADLQDNGVIRYRRLDEARCPIRPAKIGRDLQLIPIGPDENLIVATGQKALLGRKIDATVNDLAIVIVLQARQGNSYFRMLLASDAETDNLHRAMRIWAKHDENLAPDSRFESLKIPHHGSINGHWKNLCRLKSDQANAIAAISVGTQYSLPKASVIGDYLDEGWRVLSTTTRSGPSKANRVIEQFSRKSDLPQETATHDIRLAWNSRGGIEWSPTASEIRGTDLQFYPN